VEAKDTVMTDKQLQKVPIDNYRSLHDQREVAKAQAEISFPAGGTDRKGTLD